MEKQFEYFKTRDIITNSTQNNMVNVIVGLTNVLSSTFARDSGKIVNKPQMLAKEHVHVATLAKEKDANIGGG
jgi:hypothetical protein